MMLKRVLFFLLMIVLSMAAEAQDVQAPEGMICTTHRDLWLGSNEETKNITSTPVPESFRQIIETPGCRNTEESDLIEWHRRYGSEDTMEDALGYLDRTVKRTGVNMISRRKEAKPALSQQAEDFTVIARYYNMGAEAFPSLEFVKQAEQNLETVGSLCDKRKPDERRSWYNGCRLDGDATVLEKLTRDIAVTRAFITKEKADVEKAKSILERVEMPHMDSFIENAEMRFDSLCKRQRVEPSPKIKAACEEKYNEEDVRILLKQQALLASVEDRFSDDPRSKKSYEFYYDFLTMLFVTEGKELADYTALPTRHFSEERARLSLAFSDMHFHRAVKQAEVQAKKQAGGSKNLNPSKIDYEIAEDLVISLDHLLAAEKYTPRYSAPSQWQRIAAKFIERMELLNKLSPDVRNDRWVSIMDRDRQLEYFKAGLNP